MSLQVWLPLNGNLNNQGIANCSVTAGNAVSISANGKIGQCYQFTNNQNSIIIGTLTNKTSFENTGVSMGGWFKFTSLPSSGNSYGILLDLFADLDLICTLEPSQVKFGIFRGGPQSQIFQDYGPYYSTNLTDWHHIFVIFDASKADIYIDGNLYWTADYSNKFSTLWTPRLTAGFNRIDLNNSQGDTSRHINYMANDIRAYNNCLTEQEIKEIAKGLILHYPLNGAPNSNLYTRFSQLPSEYQEVEYIEANGTGIGLNIGFNLEDDGFSIRYQATKTNHNGMVLANNTSPYMWVYYYGAAIHAIRVYAVATDGNQKSSEDIFNEDLLEHNITVKNKKIYGDNILKGDFSSYTFANIGSNLRLFDGYGTSYYFYGRVFSCQFFNNSTGNCTHNFIPCYRKSDSRIGFYDIITNTFCCNDNNTNLTTGKLIKSLPNTYYPLDYIQSTGTQYINAGTTFSNTSEREFDVIWTSVNAPLYGANSGGPLEVILQINNDGLNYLNGSFTWLWYVNKRYKIYLSNLQGAQKLIVNDELIRSTGGTPCGKNEYILGYIENNGASNNTISHKAQAKLYYYFIKNNNIPIRDLRPALRISDKKPGMYDLVNDVFYVNAGSGEFLYPLSNIIYDISGYKQDGTITGDLIMSTEGPRYKKYVQYPDSACSIYIGNLHTMIPDGEFTFNIWFRKNTGEWSSKTWETILGGPGGFELESKMAGTQLAYIHPYSWGGGSTSSPNSYSIPYTLDEWHMLTMVRTNLLSKFYLDGEWKLDGTAGTIPSGNYYIGSYANITAQNYRGYLADARIYVTTLNDNDIKELYNMGRLS